jgi:hypothetical protein
MAKYREKKLVEATQWYKNGDHPDDHVGDMVSDPGGGPDYEKIEGAVVRFFRRPEVEFSGDGIHEVCGMFWHNHGFVDEGEDGPWVCPGDYVITGDDGLHGVLRKNTFEELYEKVNRHGEVIPLSERLATGHSVIPPMTVSDFNDGGEY